MKIMLVATSTVLITVRRCSSAWMITSSSSSSVTRITRRTPPTITTTRGGRRFLASTSTTSASTTEDASTATENEGNERLSSRGLSLDLKTITSQLPTVLSHMKSRRASQETMDAATKIADLASTRSSKIQERDAFLNKRREASAVVGKLMRNKDTMSEDELEQEVSKAKATSTEAADEATRVEGELEIIQTTMDDLLAGIPNLLDDVVPDGDDENDNEEIYEWGDLNALPQKLGWNKDVDDDTDDDTNEPLWHDDVALKLNGYESEAAVAMSGARFVGLSGAVAQLERALGMYFMDLHTGQHGYTEMSVPLVVSRSTLEGTSQLPKFQEDLFAITSESHTCNGEDAFLIPTAEVPVTNMHRDTVLEEADLPLSYVAWTPCFRAEAGSYGRDTKGLIRTHQFQKVELVRITTPDTSNELHEELTQHAEKCLQSLELPYRKVRLCSGDVGFAARHCYDLEVWLPGAKEYREISSCSNCGDFQSRRMSLRYRPKVVVVDTGSQQQQEEGNKKKMKKKKKPKKAKPVLCHTINGSGLALGRTLVAVLENYQRPDGSVVIPDVLRPYMGGKEIIEVPSTD